MSHKSTIGHGFEFVDNIESINLNLVTKCFLTRKPLLIVGLCLLAFVNNIQSLNLNAGCFLVGFLGPGVRFLHDSIGCPTQLSLMITFIV